VDYQTRRLLVEFDPVYREGYTLVVPANTAITKSGRQPLFQRFNINPDTISEGNATSVRILAAQGTSSLSRALLACIARDGANIVKTP
jgi:hypothetical protein